jgi:hypothetical protein
MTDLIRNSLYPNVPKIMLVALTNVSVLIHAARHEERD